MSKVNDEQYEINKKIADEISYLIYEAYQKSLDTVSKEDTDDKNKISISD